MNTNHNQTPVQIHSKITTNHNETLVRDTAAQQVKIVPTHSKITTNHNETLVRDRNA
jgi:hypothetical protein